jgi:Excalibur calcium-binding domain
MVDASTHRVRPAGRLGAVGFAPQRHRRAASAPIRTIALVATALAASLFFVIALLVADSQPIGPDSPYGALPPTSSPVAIPPSTPVGPAPHADAETTPGGGPPATLAPAVSISRPGQPAASPAALRPAAPEPRPQAVAPEPRPQPVAPEPRPPAAAPQPSPAPSASAPGPTAPAPPTPQRPDDERTYPGNGKHKGNPDPPGHDPTFPRPTDQRYATCEEVLAAGLGPYKAGRDEEYGWYPDPDGDGWACERPQWGLGRR